MISHNTSQTKVKIVFASGENTTEKTLYIPKTQKAECLDVIWNKNKHLSSMTVYAKDKVIYSRCRNEQTT